MLAYQKWGKEEIPTDKKIKPDHFVGKFYMLFNKKKTKKLEAEAQELLKKWEEKDRRTLLLWRLMTNWAIEGFKQTHKKFGIKFDVEFFESKIYKKGKKIILEGVKEGIFEKSRGGEVKINLEEEGLGEKILLRKDGTSIYIVFDLALAEMKFDKYDLDKSLYVVADEQEYHFNVLFSILKKLGFGKKEMKHISYGLVNLPHGRMKSREGTVVDADNLIEQIRVMAEKEIKKRGKIPKIKLEKRSIVIALAAIKYMLLRIDIKKSILFNPKESVSFDGDTGPYILYSYARASSIVRKSEKNETFKIPDLEDKEIELIKKLSMFSEVVIKAGKTLNPSMIANYSYQLCKIFNEFYQLHKVIGSEEETFRLVLTESFRQVLRNALHLLGIETLEEM
jgi:arginyl-tRNA synthetase